MDVIVARCAGLDVHRDTAVATVRSPGKRRGSRHQETRTIATTLRGLAELEDWLVVEQVELVGMEATGIYWKPVFAALEDRLTCWLLNAAHMHNVPGRKTDVADSAWIAQLLEHGLVRPSFVPPPEMRDLRDLTRTRAAATQERTRMVQRLEKVLQDAGIKLTSVASQAYSKSARAMLEALISGEHDPKVLAGLAKGRLRSKHDQLVEALAHRFRIEHHGVLARRLLDHIDSLDAAVAELDAEITRRLTPHADLVELICTIPGVGPKNVQVLIAEIGLDMDIFPTAGHLASWAGICPGNNASGGKRRPGRTRPGSRWLKQALTEAAWGAARTKGTYLAAHHAQIKGRAGRFKAIGATRHDIIIAYWHIVHDHVPYRDLGADWAHRRFSPEHRARRLIAQLEDLGLRVTTEPAP
ncbi:IS110 family transposase [Streptomyces malaysiensis]|uniref:IS110 family transposase n=1 Tax=Streptomyces malaysiensis subsp. samsunensis TaxID=459658 RepID=A0A9X2M392_STRMQ|nr:IS110 family transposase [Streptomyces samsunensis]MCQ8834871.1 IS110 family transposase [Streptomyces samsunensis]